jgi:type I restriction-modification system DNA methylase subunit
MLESIQSALESFSGGNLTENALNLFQTLGYESERQLPFEDKSFADFASYLKDEAKFSEKNALVSEWRYVDLLFQLTESELEKQNLLFEHDKTIDQRMTSYLFFVIELKHSSYNRTKLSQITREVNKVFQIPVMILFKYGASLTLAVIDRQPHQRDESKDVLRKVTLVKDINFPQPHRAHLENLFDLSLEQLQKNHPISDFLSLHNAWQKTLDVELVTNKFFKDYKRVFEKVEAEIENSIADKETARLFNQRLFNRLMFIYFVQKKGWLEFAGNKNYLRSLFGKAAANGENFFHERLYWVFFYGLGTNVESREPHDEPALQQRRGTVPYLNGGLFEMEKDGFDERGKVSLPNSLFADILNLFEHYNFTVEESTPLEVQVAIDPEILGRVFEELVTGRHESGSYYTPRQIVSFMCRESLKHYLAPHDSSTAIAEFVDDGNGENLVNPEKILDALKQIRICDPACGSGAYLLGMMQELLRLRESLFTAKHLGDASLYNRKREIIENNIYGVDKDRFAVQIASLRLWLSLAIESQEPRALPNLKYKIGCGDALLAPLENDSQPDLHRRALIEQFRARKTEYSGVSDYGKKSEIDAEIERLRVEIAQSLHHMPEPPKPYQIIVAEKEVQPLREKIQRLLKEGNKLKAETEQKNLNKLLASIAEWKRQIDVKDYTPDFFDWTVEFAEVFTEGGFDIVLANPPYVRMELFKPIKPALRQNFPKVHSDRADLYVYFFARAMQLLKPNGIGAFISSNKWLKAGYGEPLRQELLDKQKFHLVVDFGDLPVFNATAYPAVFVWQNAERKETMTAWAVVQDLPLCYAEGVREHVNKISLLLPAVQFGKDGSRLSDAGGNAGSISLQSIKSRLRDFVDNRVMRGIVTGLNEAFVIDEEIKRRLIKQDSKSAEILMPLLAGDDVRRYEINFRQSYLIYTNHGVDISRYPAIENYLKSFRSKLEGRATAQEWYELQQPQAAFRPFFNADKIIYPQISLAPRFYFDEKKFYLNQKCFMMPSKDLFLLAVLNSSFIWQIIKQGSPPLRGGYSEPRRDFILNLPIPDAPADERETIAGLAEETQKRHGERRAKVERFLLDSGTSAAESTSRNPLEQVWTLTGEEFSRRTRSRFDASIFHRAKEETFALTEQITRIEREIDLRVAELYGVKLENE